MAPFRRKAAAVALLERRVPARAQPLEVRTPVLQVLPRPAAADAGGGGGVEDVALAVLLSLARASAAARGASALRDCRW